MIALRTALKERARELSQQVLDGMYENPFWMERYGARGRQFADEDSLHHISYLEQALAAGDAAVFVKYARWLRTVLISRGMCSAHLAENFHRLSEAIGAAGLPDAAAAQNILERGEHSLKYTEGDAAELQAQEALLLTAVQHALPPGHAMRADDQVYLVSYLLDSIAIGNTTHFEGFAGRFPAAVVDALRTRAWALQRQPPDRVRPH